MRTKRKKGGSTPPNHPVHAARDEVGDPLLTAAEKGWGVTTRYAVLSLVTRWPAVASTAGGTAAIGVALVVAYARAHGWL